MVTEREWRTLWLWIESGAPFAGSYAGLRNAVQQARAGAAMQPLHAALPVVARRCARCHTGAEPGSDQPMRLPYDPQVWDRRALAGRPTGDYERIVLEKDPIARYSIHVLLNFSRPALSPLLLAPLARSAGGWGLCPEGFADAADPDYQRLLAALEQGRGEFEVEPRYGTPNFQPNPQYLREMSRFGILADARQGGAGAWDVFQLEQAYWQSLWRQNPGVTP
jgi:hypothetical protein